MFNNITIFLWSFLSIIFFCNHRQFFSENLLTALVMVARRFVARAKFTVYRKCMSSALCVEWLVIVIVGSRLVRNNSVDGHISGAPGSCPV